MKGVRESFAVKNLGLLKMANVVIRRVKEFSIMNKVGTIVDYISFLGLVNIRTITVILSKQ